MNHEWRSRGREYFWLCQDWKLPFLVCRSRTLSMRPSTKTSTRRTLSYVCARSLMGLLVYRVLIDCCFWGHSLDVSHLMEYTGCRCDDFPEKPRSDRLLVISKRGILSYPTLIVAKLIHPNEVSIHHKDIFPEPMLLDIHKLVRQQTADSRACPQSPTNTLILGEWYQTKTTRYLIRNGFGAVWSDFIT